MIRASIFAAAVLVIGGAGLQAQACSEGGSAAAVTGSTVVADMATDLSSAKRKKKSTSTTQQPNTGTAAPQGPASSSPSGY